LMLGERRMEKVMGRFSHGLIYVWFPHPHGKFSGRTKKIPHVKSQFRNSLSSSRFELHTSQKQSCVVTTVRNYFYLLQMQELGTSEPILNFPIHLHSVVQRHWEQLRFIWWKFFCSIHVAPAWFRFVISHSVL
jgi:hypothetical protein